MSLSVHRHNSQTPPTTTGPHTHRPHIASTSHTVPLTSLHCSTHSPITIYLFIFINMMSVPKKRLLIKCQTHKMNNEEREGQTHRHSKLQADDRRASADVINKLVDERDNSWVVSRPLYELPTSTLSFRPDTQMQTPTASITQQQFNHLSTTTRVSRRH